MPGLLLTVCLLATSAHASILGALLAQRAGANRFLPASRAYRLHARRVSPRKIILRWRIARGYYLYRGKIRIREIGPPGGRLSFTLPPGAPRQEPQGPVAVYYDRLVVPVRLGAGTAGAVTLRVSYQGCAVRGLCYPPVHRTLLFGTGPEGASSPVPPAAAPRPSTPSAGPAASSPAAVPPQPRTEARPAPHPVLHRTLGEELLLFFLGGILLAFTPCGAPMIPILLATLGRAGGGGRKGRAFAALIYVLAVAFTYGLLGLLAAAAGHDLIPFFENPWVVGVFAALFAFYGTAMLAGWRLELPESWRARLAGFGGAGHGRVLGPAALGVSSALLASPCLTPAVAAGLTLAIYQGAALRGALFLFVLGLGLGIPLLAAALAAGTFWPRGGPWLRAVETLMGFVLYALALWFAARVLPAPAVALLLGVLFALAAAFLYPFGPRAEGDGRSGVRYRLALAFVLALLALSEILGGLAGTRSVLAPLRPLVGVSGRVQRAPPGLVALTVRSPEELAQALARARREGRPALVDYDARWCVSCALMDRTVFRDRRVVAALRRVVFIRADVTRDDRASEKLLSLYHVLGPPTFLYFASPSGQPGEAPTARLIGARDTRGFLRWLGRLLPGSSRGREPARVRGGPPAPDARKLD